MKSQIPHNVRCNITGEAAEEIWHWSLLGVKGLKQRLLPSGVEFIRGRGYPTLFPLTPLIAYRETRLHTPSSDHISTVHVRPRGKWSRPCATGGWWTGERSRSYRCRGRPDPARWLPGASGVPAWSESWAGWSRCCSWLRTSWGQSRGDLPAFLSVPPPLQTQPSRAGGSAAAAPPRIAAPVRRLGWWLSNPVLELCWSPPWHAGCVSGLKAKHLFRYGNYPTIPCYQVSKGWTCDTTKILLFDVISVGQSSSPWPCKLGERRNKFHLECKLRFPCAQFMLHRTKPISEYGD